METWIFQANPDQFQVNSYLVSGREIRWTVRQKHLAPAMAPGDSVYIWRASGKRKGHGPAGIIASGTLLRGPLEEPDDHAALECWAEAPTEPELRVRVQIERVASTEEVLQRDWLRVDPVLRDLRILKMAAATNYGLTQRQSVRVAGLWRNQSRPWLPRELLAVLWIKVSATASHAQAGMDSRIEAVAIQIDRTVHAVKNKLQELGASDGLLPNGEGRESTQPELLLRERYRNAASGKLDADRIQSDYFTMWRARSRSGLWNEADTPPDRATDREEGQGYESDPRVRRAIESRAMQLAIEHYRTLGFIVEDTSAMCSYDLRCLLGAEEVRVEVKGTQSEGDAVFVTRAEVNNAHGLEWRTDLFIVSRIQIQRGDIPSASGGSVRWIRGWRPRSDDLEPTQYRCRVPKD